jgi:hypothetical protein
MEKTAIDEDITENDSILCDVESDLLTILSPDSGKL